MDRDLVGEVIFWATLVFALALYLVSAPAGLPWNGSTELALAYGGRVAELPDMTYPVWGYFIQVFGGHFVALSAVALAIAGGLVGAMVNRYCNWRVGTAAALAFVMLPSVWDRAITGAHGAFGLFGIVLGLWLVNAIILIISRRARWNASVQGIENQQKTISGFWELSWRVRLNRITAWVLLGASVVFAIVSAVQHNYNVGEAASAYARVMLEEAGDRFVILNGIANDQMVWEAEKREKGSSERLIAYRNDAAYRQELLARVRHEWPTDTNLWVSVQVSAGTFAEVVVRNYPDRVYVMTGQTTTPEKWAARWEALKGYLDSGDAFVPVMRRAFAFEGNTLGNQLQKEGKLKEAWMLYIRIFQEIDPFNSSAVVNLSEMLRRGYAVDASTRKNVEDAMAELGRELKGERAAQLAAAIVASCGPVLPDPKVIAEYRAQIARRLREMEEEGRTPKWELPAELKSLIEWNNDMLKAHDRGDIDLAARIARTILSKSEWRSFIPANAIMGSAMALEGDYVASEAFYRVAVSGKEEPPAITCNDYADTLRHLGRFDEAEQYARRAIAKTDANDWICRLTLAEILRDAKKNPEEMKKLLIEVLKRVPMEMREEIRKDFKR